MRDGKHCPACGVDIGLWPVVSATLPSRIRCPRCKARLAYRDVAPVVLVLVLVSAPVFAFAYLASLWFVGAVQLAVLLAVLFAAWVPVELLAAKYLRANKVLECRPDGRPPAEGGDAGPGRPHD